MKAAELYEDIREYCKKHADKKYAKKHAKFFIEGYDAYGLSKDIFEDKVHSLINDENISMRLILSTSKLLIKSGKYEEAHYAIRLLHELSDQYDEKTFSHIEQWFKIGIINWGHCDVLCVYQMTTLFEKKLITLDNLSDWRNAENKYQRRAVPVAMLVLLKMRKNYKPLFKFIEPLMMDPEKKVQQGLGWFLREAWKINPKETEAFLLKWKNDAPRIIFQYATEKMTAVEKKRFRKEKKL